MLERLRELVAHASRAERLYPVKTDEDRNLFCGRLADGCQLLATLDVRLLLMVALFDAAGHLAAEESGTWRVAGQSRHMATPRLITRSCKSTCGPSSAASLL